MTMCRNLLWHGNVAQQYTKRLSESTSSYMFLSIWYGARKKESWRRQLQELQRQLEVFMSRYLTLFCWPQRARANAEQLCSGAGAQ